MRDTRRRSVSVRDVVRAATRVHRAKRRVVWGGREHHYDEELRSVFTFLPHFSAGTYGCAYKKGFSCEGEYIDPTKRVLTKTARETDDGEENREVVVSALVRTIPHYKQYYAPVLRDCKPKPEVEKLLRQDCKVLRDRDGHDRPFRNLLMNYVGDETWADRVDHVVLGVRDHPVRKARAYWLSRTRDLLRWWERMDRALTLLARADVCHYDLKSNNIIMSNYGVEVPIIIDFGLSLPMQTVRDLWAQRDWHLVYYFYNTSTDYPAWCFEIIVLSKLCADAAERAEHIGTPTTHASEPWVLVEAADASRESQVFGGASSRGDRAALRARSRPNPFRWIRRALGRASLPDTNDTVNFINTDTSATNESARNATNENATNASNATNDASNTSNENASNTSNENASNATSDARATKDSFSAGIRRGAPPSAFEGRLTYAEIAPLIDVYFNNKFLRKMLPGDRWRRAKRRYHEYYRQLAFDRVEQWIDHLLASWQTWDKSALGFIVWETIRIWAQQPAAPSILASMETLVLEHWVLPPQRTTHLGSRVRQLLRSMDG